MSNGFSMSRQQLIHRLKWYYPLERFHAIITFPAMIVYLVLNYPYRDIVSPVFGLIVCDFILFQGQHYWKLKLNRLTGQHFDQTRHIGLFKRAKKVNILLIVLIPMVFMLQLGLKDWTIPADELLVWTLGANGFAVLEYINYYHIQLMVDNKADASYVLRNKRFKTASLKKDLSDGEI